MGKYAFVGSKDTDSITVVDISNPISLTIVGSFTSLDLDNVYDVIVDGEHAYLASRDADSLTIIDIGLAVTGQQARVGVGATAPKRAYVVTDAGDSNIRLEVKV